MGILHGTVHTCPPVPCCRLSVTRGEINFSGRWEDGWRLDAKCRARVGLTPNDVGFTECSKRASAFSRGKRDGCIVFFCTPISPAGAHDSGSLAFLGLDFYSLGTLQYFSLTDTHSGVRDCAMREARSVAALCKHAIQNDFHHQKNGERTPPPPFRVCARNVCWLLVLVLVFDQLCLHTSWPLISGRSSLE